MERYLFRGHFPVRRCLNGRLEKCPFMASQNNNQKPQQTLPIHLVNKNKMSAGLIEHVGM